MKNQNDSATSLVLRQRQELANPVPATPPRRSTVPKRAKTGKLALAGVSVLALFFGGITYWSANAPLASAAIAQGQVSLETNRKVVQHLEGGIISEIRFREGQQVEAGDVLFILDQTQIEATNTLLRAKIASAKTQAGLIREELKSVEALLRQGYSRKPRLLALKRSLAEITGQKKQDEVRLSANLDTMKRAEIKAPVSGAIVGLQVHTTGGVIKAGEELLSIVPKEERLVIEARVDPNDIDIVQTGLKTHVRLTPYSARLLAPVPGAVDSISADRLKDDVTGQEYYLARIALKDQEITGLKNVKLMPGMPVEVAIMTGSRSVMDYLLAPLLKSFGRAFMEE
jgi:multidrug efflux pump subunit AcrA (membrane-fusion protein)